VNKPIGARVSAATLQVIREFLVDAEHSVTCRTVAQVVGKTEHTTRAAMRRLQLADEVQQVRLGVRNGGHVVYHIIGRQLILPPELCHLSIAKKDRPPLVQKRQRRVDAKQIGMHRDPLVEALFGEAKQKGGAA
jgi:hypothetical protein